MAKPSVIIDPNWRRMDELFAPDIQAALARDFDLIWARDEKMPASALEEALPKAFALVQCAPRITAAELEAAPGLRAVIEVSGGFPPDVDYAACAARGVEVLSCAPGFRRAVAEMTLAMILGAGRGLVAEHEAFRTGAEAWLADCPSRDFTLFGAEVGFVGFGAIARETLALMAPFSVKTRAFDPWMPLETIAQFGAEACELEPLLAASQIVMVAAAPSKENRGLIGAKEIAAMRPGALLVVISRAHLVDFDAVLAAANSGRIRAAIDVFPAEPVAPDDPMRQTHGVIFSPHRAAAVPGGRQQIGELILEDLRAMAAGRPERGLGVADPAKVALTAGVGDAGGIGHFGGTQ